MIEKILKDIKGLFKVQDKAKFLKQNIPYLVLHFSMLAISSLTIYEPILVAM